MQRSARWLEASSAAPGRFCYVNHQAWRQSLAAGYVAARTARDTEDTEGPLPIRDGPRLREHTAVVPAGQLADWVLYDLQEEASHVLG